MADIGTINAIFQQYLGRLPTQYEMQGFGQAIDQGTLDPIGLSMFIQSTQEYQSKNIPAIAQQYQQQLQPMLQQANQQALGQAYDVAKGKMAGQGRPDSSAITGQFAQAAQGLAGQNAQMMAQGVGGMLGNAYGQQIQQQQGYGQNYANMYSQQQNAQAQLNLAKQGYGYYTNEREIALNQSRKNNQGSMWGGIAGAAGGLVGGIYGGPMGAAAGYGAGKALGTGLGGQ